MERYWNRNREREKQRERNRERETESQIETAIDRDIILAGKLMWESPTTTKTCK